MRTRSTALLLGGFAAITLLAACGGDSDDDSSGSTPSEQADLVMTGTGSLKWEPTEASVAAGDVTVELRNNSNVLHNLYIVAEDGTENPEFLESTGMNDNPTETIALTPGSYTIICKVPGHADMKAALTVT